MTPQSIDKERQDLANPAAPLLKRDPRTDHMCPFCGVKKLDRERTVSHTEHFLSLFCLYPYRCRNCFRTVNKFHFGLRFWLQLLLLIGLIAGASWALATIILPRFLHSPAATHTDAVEGVRANAGQLSPFEKMMVQKHQQTLDNETVIRLTKSGIGTGIILKMIQNSNHEFDVSANAIIELKKTGVDESIIFAMLDASSDQH